MSSVCASLLFGPCTEAVCSLGSFTDAQVFAQIRVCERAQERVGGGGLRLTLSRHETVLLSCVQPHETPRVGADAHGQSALLNKSTTGGDAETHKRLKQERGEGGSRLVCLHFAGKRKRLPEPLNL